MNKSNYLRGISLAGFQVFDALTDIPLDRLTVLLGPNSAGKSAVEDALRLIYILQSVPGDFSRPLLYWSNVPPGSSMFSVMDEPRVELLLQELRKSWRRTGSPARLADEMHVHIRLDTEFDPCTPMLGRAAATQVELQYRFFQQEVDGLAIDDVLDDSGGLTFALVVKVNSETALVYNHADWACALNTQHPSLRVCAMSGDWTALSQAHQEYVKCDGDSVAFLGLPGFRFSGWELNGTTWGTSGNTYPGLTAVLSADPEYVRAAAEFSKVFGSILHNLRESCNVLVRAVPASRTIPSPESLIFRDGPEWFEDGPERSTFGGARRPAALGSRKNVPESDFYRVLNDPTTLDTVNDYLSHHLFIEKGYRVVRHGFVLVTEDAFDTLDQRVDGTRKRAMGFVARFNLEDASGTQFAFDEVGSGLGYVLPVLCAIAHGASHEGLTFVQQPELHLHPALQAELADAFIEASSASQQILIESHSEHFLLRILKRVRQTVQQKSGDNGLSVSAADVVVLYFDPMPSGSTAVRQIRLSQDGEFLDRWPRGFFSERDRELFDE